MFLTRHFITWRFFPVPTSGRDEISELAHNKSRTRFLATMWKDRKKKMGRRKPIRSQWPLTCLRNGVYVLPRQSNITPIRQRP